MAFKTNLILFILLVNYSFSMAQHNANYDESKVPDITLPDPFVSLRGKLISTQQDWEEIRRPEILDLFREYVYGNVPTDFDQISFSEVQEGQNPYPEKALLKEVNITVSRKGKSHTMRLNVFLPKNGDGPFPIFFLVNHRAENKEVGLVEEGYWSVSELIDRGYATASFHGETVAPDDAERFSEGILTTLYPEELGKADGMRTFGAWAWAAMRAMDYFEQDPLYNTRKSALIGHSRSGKTALWAGANDPRWSVVYSNESGCGGAAISRRKYGETVAVINSSFPHWFADNFKAYNGQEETLPVDQHMLAALIAPRALYFASARGDQWADPKGEYISMQLGSRVYSEIYQQEVTFPLAFEEIASPIIQPFAGYHIRDGKHNLTWEDWKNFIDFAEIQWKQIR
ncbi:acetylxylan esterase [Algoriphagus aquimarinus]|uniref:glucuronyl esterase domain-containing protein n=1 Tax=Algoriphagus aquimarinus TaxID=237018 RepID=UPI0030DA7AC0|tara:strand:- start:73124 stop:74323 length:1200 start_codon:yes stop_codon:yes gene_type:complete